MVAQNILCALFGPDPRAVSRGEKKHFGVESIDGTAAGPRPPLQRLTEISVMRGVQRKEAHGNSIHYRRMRAGPLGMSRREQSIRFPHLYEICVFQKRSNHWTMDDLGL
jgi:hypothetical protein